MAAYIQPIILLLCSTLLYSAATAQVKVSGYVTNKQQAGIEGAGVSFKGAATGAVTDSTGYFQFSTPLRGTQVLTASSIGYKPYAQAVNLTDTGITVHVILAPDHKTLGEVVISAGAFEASDKAKGASLTPMDAMTVAGNNGDIANSLRSLPGAQQVGEREGLFVRGGAGEETKQFVDGTLLKNPNFASVPGIIQPARINPFLFKGVLFSTGGYSAQYGQAMSSALILESVDLPESSSASLHIFPSNSGAGFQRLAKNKKSSFGISADYGNLQLYNSVIKQRPHYFKGPEYGRAEGNYRVKTGKSGMLKLYVNSTFSNVGMRNPDVDTSSLQSAFTLHSRNVYANISYRQMLGANWQLQAAGAYSYNRDSMSYQLQNAAHANIKVDAPFAWKYRSWQTQTHFAQGRVVLTRLFANNQALHLGAEHFYTANHYRSNDTLYPLTDQLSAAFAEGDIFISDNMMARAGVRVERSSLLEKTTIAPRASLAYRFANGGQVNLAYGMFYQEPENLYLYQQRALDFSRADHYIINYTRKANNRLLRVEAYYKKYHHLVKTYPVINSSGNGDAKGIELFWRDKRTFPNFDYWISYTYLHTQRNYLAFPYALQPTFATPHTASLVVKRYFHDINLDVNVAYSFATGRPYYDIRSPQEHMAPQLMNQGTTRAYHNVNLSGAYMFCMFPKWKHKDFSGIGFGVNNILGTRQVFGYQYSYNGLNKMPVLPAAARSYYIGLFMSFGIDRTEDFINNNL
ncbi:MAG TPA: TonB-dependent receptor [Chitinophaga sp.]|uniref:TonB-dependent receptor n=1 Tax=Chitinophaga sp. TaxID=1869181 RepID=UPI002DBACC59|nr:TonB-dependent receptor [Chitinophaga sp.]HEU4554307.1 TonB-dependent receptor [Chitinophaga sp.]